MTTPLLDFDTLTAPIAGDQPAGTRLPMDVRKKMEDARKDFEPNPDNPSAPPVPKKPDWPLIVKLASDSLAKTSKDLLAAVRLTEALGKRDEFAGLRDGLKLLNLLVVDCWDRIHPLIEDPEDLEARAGPFQWLCDAESGAWFPTAVSNFALVTIGGQAASLKECQSGQLDPVALQAAEPATPTIGAEIVDCLKELDALDRTLSEKLAEHAPSLAGLRDVLSGCNLFLGHLRSPEAEQAAAGQSGGAAPSGSAAAGGRTSRADMYRQLARLADDLARMEPHSPIPDLLRWAVRLGEMPFRDLIQELVREPGVLADIRRQFGIKEPEGASSE